MRAGTDCNINNNNNNNNNNNMRTLNSYALRRLPLHSAPLRCWTRSHLCTCACLSSLLHARPHFTHTPQVDLAQHAVEVLDQVTAAHTNRSGIAPHPPGSMIGEASHTLATQPVGRAGSDHASPADRLCMRTTSMRAGRAVVCERAHVCCLIPARQPVTSIGDVFPPAAHAC